MLGRGQSSRPHLTLGAAVYGKCIVADYNAVHKDKCVNEFMKLKDCYLKASRK
ncbi:hypothetical protein EDB81DRAFT_497346 [Dactylonectria macrodidyma]|uniref:Uncharacterized protein n=1 Tax=Dactylonectria macrodidyma TaxID=307937 RepID=A0A9P9J498_9HYPO|nr:hypothetical protein EDB81DRAFT_497346 [Dactylonectria macrodidyma]